MTQQSTPLRVAVGLLLASAALPFATATAQEIQPPADPTAGLSATPTVNTPPPVAPIEEPAETLPSQTTVPAAPVATGPIASEPVVNTRASGNEPADPGASGVAAAERRPAVRQRVARSTPAPRPRASEPREAVSAPAAPVSAAAPAVTPDPASVSAGASPIPAPAPVAEVPVEAPAAAVDPAPATEGQGNAGFLPWLLAGLAVIAGLILFARRRRRTVDEDHLASTETAAPVYDEPTRAVPLAGAGAAAGLAGAAAAADDSAGRPWLDLQMRPVRAGVAQDAARVEFELGVENNGAAPARDVRVSAWLLAGNSPLPSEMESMLIKGGGAPQIRETSLTPGETRTIETAVALPRAQLEDAILPVVVAEARYLLPDGAEGRTSASFAVSVPVGEDLAVFDVENPSGLHDGVEARLFGEPRRD